MAFEPHRGTEFSLTSQAGLAVPRGHGRGQTDGPPCVLMGNVGKRIKVNYETIAPLCASRGAPPRLAVRDSTAPIVHPDEERPL
jgi:hypothetical protein